MCPGSDKRMSGGLPMLLALGISPAPFPSLFPAGPLLLSGRRRRQWPCECYKPLSLALGSGEKTALASVSCVVIWDSHYLQWKLWFVSQFSFLFVHSCLSSSRQLFVGALASKVPFSSCVNYRCHKHLRHGAGFLIQMQTSWGGKQVFRSIASPGDISIGHMHASDKPN